MENIGEDHVMVGYKRNVVSRVQTCDVTLDVINVSGEKT